MVSHGQDDLVQKLLSSVARHCDGRKIQVTVVRNIPESRKLLTNDFPFPVAILQNRKAKGFSANHNQAFALCRAEYFCVLNPDIILISDPFPRLIAALRSRRIGVVAPTIMDPRGNIQDSARRFPTPIRILRRIFRRVTGRGIGPLPEAYRSRPDWVAGMFMFLTATVFRNVGGFDEKFFMYCEDADLCMRLQLAGFSTLLLPDVHVVHDARRASHYSLRHLAWHTHSLIRFFYRYPFHRL